MIATDPLADPRELVVNARTGSIRQAGATTPWGPFVEEYKTKAETSLYHFAKGILKYDFVTRPLHEPECQWLTTFPSRRKLWMLPREHAKTVLGGISMPTHMLIQPAATNIYFPGEEGSETRILLGGETEEMAKSTLRVIGSHFEGNVALRALWPHRCWDNPRKDAKKWNELMITVPRAREYRDPSVRAIGVGGAITGAHPSVLILDDLTTLAAANSPVVMSEAIRWYTASRALINSDLAICIVIGTRWSTTDLYDHIQRNDPTVDVRIRAVLEKGAPIFPPRDLPKHRKHIGFSLEKIDGLRRHHGPMFPLLYMNTAIDAAISDFDVPTIPRYRLVGAEVVFDHLEDGPTVPRSTPTPTGGLYAGQRLTRELWSLLARDGVRLRAS